MSKETQKDKKTKRRGKKVLVWAVINKRGSFKYANSLWIYRNRKEAEEECYEPDGCKVKPYWLTPAKDIRKKL